MKAEIQQAVPLVKKELGDLSRELKSDQGTKEKLAVLGQGLMALLAFFRTEEEEQWYAEGKAKPNQLRQMGIQPPAKESLPSSPSPEVVQNRADLLAVNMHNIHYYEKNGQPKAKLSGFALDLHRTFGCKFYFRPVYVGAKFRALFRDFQ